MSARWLPAGFSSGIVSPADLILIILAAVLAMVGVIASWVAGHPEDIQMFFRTLRDRPQWVRLRQRYRRESDFLVRRFQPEGAYGLTLTVGLAILAASTWLFAGILQDVLAQEEIALVDAPVMRYVAEHRVEWLTIMMRGLTELSRAQVIVVLVVGAGLVFRWHTGRWYPLILLATAATGSGLLDLMIKLAIARPRPPAAWMVVPTAGYAFPSGHTTQSAVYAVLAYLGARVLPGWRAKVRIWALAIALAFLIGTSRVYLGVHWLTDVLGGWALAAAWLAILLTTTSTIERIRAAPPSRTAC